MARYRIDNQPARIDFEAREYPARAVQNAKNLLMTVQGDIPYDRMRGLDPIIYDRQLPQVWQMLPQEIDRLLEWAPTVEMVSVGAELDERGQLVIEVEIEVEDA